eukprot:3137698-Prymnesium_polylepis.1
MGAPRRPCLTLSNGVLTRRSPPSLNAKSGPMRPPKWLREIKPTAADGARASVKRHRGLRRPVHLRDRGGL